MKKLILMFTVAIVAATLQTANAQVSLNINIGAQPNWGPRGYDYVEYYYMPEVQSYYHVPTKRFVYLEGNSWVHRRNLPRVYRNYNLHSMRKVVINRPQAYLHHQEYRPRYVQNNYRNDNGKHKGWYKEREQKRNDRDYRKDNRRGDNGNHRGGRH